MTKYLLALIAALFSFQSAYSAIDDKRVDSFDVVNYNILLNITDFSNKQIYGNTVIKAVSNINSLDKIRLDLEQLQVDSVLYKDNKATYQHTGHVLNISLPAPLAKGDSFEIDVHYSGNPGQDPSGWGGFYFNSGYAFNLGVGFQVDPHTYGRAWFPCVDNFTDRATYTFFIETDINHNAICNGDLKGIVTGDSTVMWLWELEQPIPTYLASVAVGEYTMIYSTIQGQEKQATSLLAVQPTDSAAAMVAFQHLPGCYQGFEEAYGPHKFDKVGYVSVPFNSGAMEHATNIAYPRYAILGGLEHERLMAHEFAHHWWGDNTTCRTAADMWLNEGWASYSESIFQEKVYGKEAYRKNVLANHYKVLRFAHWNDGGYIPVSPVSHENTYGDHVYKKGADVAHSLRHQMGDDSFFTAITAFQNKYSFNDVSSEDFRDHLLNYYPAASAFFDAWVFSPGFTHVAIRDYDVEQTGSSYILKNLSVAQQLKERTEPYKNLKSFVTVMDNNWNKEVKEITLNPDVVTDLDVSVEPAFVAMNMNGELADATTKDHQVIRSTGTYNYPEALMEITVDKVEDSALFYVEHHWVGAWNRFTISGVKTSGERYWRVDGIWPEGFEVSAEIMYYGRTPASGVSGGYMDEELINTVEDSLVLLYRTEPTDSWRVYNDYVKTMGNPGDKAGQISINKLRKGEYTFGIKDHTINVKSEAKDEGSIHLYPNPTDNQLNIKLIGGEMIEGLRVYDNSGKLILDRRFKRATETQSIDTSALAGGSYILEVNSTGRAYRKSFIVK